MKLKHRFGKKLKAPEKSKVFLSLVAELNNLDDEEIAMFLGNIRAYKKLKKGVNKLMFKD